MGIFSRLFSVLGLISVFVSPCQASESTAAIETFTLKNGMEVVLIPSHRVAAVTQMLWYRVGAADDFTARSGLAHYNEHMMFQGTQKTKGGEFARIVSKAGGRFNAFTSRDFTAYYESIAKENLALMMEMEADRMFNLAPTPENFTKERQVIIEERRMSIENQPSALLGEEMQALLFRVHPYHTPVIGWMHEMEALSREDVLAFHRQFYRPANAVLVVAGDITRAELTPLAEKYYGSLPAGEKYIRHWQEEPPQRGARHTVLYDSNVKQPEFSRYYLAPSVGDASKPLVIPAFLLAQYSGGGISSYLYQSLVVKQKLATTVSAGYDGLSIGAGIFEISAVPAPGIELPVLEAAIDNALMTLQTTQISDEELKRVKVLLKADTLYARDSMENMARIIGQIIMAGLPADYFNQWSGLVDAVKPEDILHAAKVIFNSNNSVTGYLLPQKDAK